MTRCKKDEPKIPTTLNDIDGNNYNVIVIGTQVWMKENLKTTKYSNADLIGTTTPATLDITTESSPKYQWAVGGDENNVATYGRLYTWYAVTDSRNVCPTGWHLPNDTEWTTLINYLGNPSISGGKIKEVGTLHWQSPNIGATNESSFTALPAGFRTNMVGDGLFPYKGLMGCWWSSSEMFVANYGILGGSISLINNSAAVSNAEMSWSSAIGYTDKGQGFSVRCIRD